MNGCAALRQQAIDFTAEIARIPQAGGPPLQLFLHISPEPVLVLGARYVPPGHRLVARREQGVGKLLHVSARRGAGLREVFRCCPNAVGPGSRAKCRRQLRIQVLQEQEEFVRLILPARHSNREVVAESGEATPVIHGVEVVEHASPQAKILPFDALESNVCYLGEEFVVSPFGVEASPEDAAPPPADPKLELRRRAGRRLFRH